MIMKFGVIKITSQVLSIWRIHLIQIVMDKAITKLTKWLTVIGIKTVQECKKLAKGERFVVLGLICYCDKTGTDVYQRNSLEPFSFTFCLFNHQCR